MSRSGHLSAMALSVEEFRLPSGEQAIYNGVAFPLALKASNGTKENSIQWLTAHKSELQDKIAKHGAILFRGWPLSDAKDFMSFLDALKFEFGSYLGGGGPRYVVLGPIHTSTESPPDFFIPYHHELAYLTTFPAALSFFCEIPSKSRGETPILLSNRVYERLLAENKAFVDKVTEKKIIYTRVIQDKSVCNFQYQRSWQDAFETGDRAEAEARSRNTGGDHIEWLPDGSMKVTTRPLEAIRIEPRTGKHTWFNSIVLLHPAAHSDKIKEGQRSPWEPRYGDGTAIADDDVRHAQRIMAEEGVAYRWQQGDVLVVDNMLALHARNPFEPPRRILAAIISNWP